VNTPTQCFTCDKYSGTLNPGKHSPPTNIRIRAARIPIEREDTSIRAIIRLTATFEPRIRRIRRIRVVPTPTAVIGGRCIGNRRTLKYVKLFHLAFVRHR
jgi:hypothetical protein